MRKKPPVGPPSPVVTREGVNGDDLQVIYGANADVRKVLMLFNVAASQFILDPDAADHMASQLIAHAQLARGRVQ